MSSLVFEVLDAHVIHGRADHIAVSDASGEMTYAQLLHQSACIAGGLGHMGVEAGTSVLIDVEPGRHLVVCVLALARIGALPAADAEFAISGTPPTLKAPDTEVDWDLLDKAGRTEPAQAPESDPAGYESALRDSYGEIIDVLERGGTVTVPAV